MKPTARSVRVQGDADRKSGDRSSRSSKRSAHRMRMLVFACNTDDAQHMMKYGDRIEVAYLPSYDMEEIREEIERFNPDLVLCGAEAFLDPRVGQPASHAPGASKDGTHTSADGFGPPIARREMRVLAMLAKGQTNDEIARALRLSSRTVKRILTSLYERLHVTNRTELTARAAELSLFKEDI